MIPETVVGISEKCRIFPQIFGCVTTGETWQFLRLEGTVVGIDRTRYYIDNVGAILAILQEAVAWLES